MGGADADPAMPISARTGISAQALNEIEYGGQALSTDMATSMLGFDRFHQ